MIAVRTLTDGGQTSPQIAQSIADYLGAAERTLEIALYDVRLHDPSAQIVRSAFDAARARVGRVERLVDRRRLVVRERERPARARVVRVARHHVRVQVRQRVPEQVVVQLDRPQVRLDGAADA